MKVNNRNKINLYAIDFLDHKLFQFQHFLWKIFTYSREWVYAQIWKFIHMINIWLMSISFLTKHRFNTVSKLFLVRLQMSLLEKRDRICVVTVRHDIWF